MALVPCCSCCGLSLLRQLAQPNHSRSTTMTGLHPRTCKKALAVCFCNDVLLEASNTKQSRTNILLVFTFVASCSNLYLLGPDTNSSFIICEFSLKTCVLVGIRVGYPSLHWSSLARCGDGLSGWIWLPSVMCR